MTLRAQALELVQFGKEATLGTAVAASKRLQGLMVDMDPNIPTDDVIASGTMAPVGVVVGKEHTVVNFSGQAGFNELAYLSASCICQPAITTPAGNGAFTLALGEQSSGTFTLTFNSQTTTDIAYDASANDIKSAIEALSTVGAGNVAVSGTGPFTVTFQGILYRTPLALTGDFSSLENPGNASVTGTAGSTSRRWSMNLSGVAASTFDSFTVEKGQAAGLCVRVAGVRVDELEMTFVPDKSIDIKAKAFGQEMADGVTITASPTNIAYKPLSPRNVGVYLATSEAGLVSGAKIQPLELKWKIGNRHTPFFTLDPDEVSYRDIAERGIMLTGQFTVEHNSAADAYMTALRAGTVYYLRVEVTGETIETGYPYRFVLTTPVQFRKNARNPKSDVHCSVLDFQSVYDGSFVLKAFLDTALTAL